MIPDTTMGDTWIISGKCKSATDVACNTRALTWGNRFLEANSKSFKSLASSASTLSY